MRHAGPRRAARLLAAKAISVTGDGAFLVAVPLLAASLTSDPFTLSVVAAAMLLPWLLFGLPAGALADRWSRRRTMVVADLARAAILCVLVVLLATGHAGIGVLIVAVIVIGAGTCMFDAAAQGAIPTLVGRDKAALTHVNGRFSAYDTIGRSFAGPALGSAGFALGRSLPFAADALSFLASALFVRRLPELHVQRPRTSIAADIRAGLRFVAGHREVRFLVVAACVNNSAFTCAFATFVLYATDVLHVPQAWYGILIAASAAGAVAAEWWVEPLTRRFTHWHALALSCAGQAVAWAGIALAGDVWVTAALLALFGAASGIGAVALMSARQEATPDELLGRVTSVFRIAGTGVTALAALAGGLLATAYGLAFPMYAAAAALAVLAAVIRLRR
ncbi:MFS transporter [Paractinoplanes maris]|uniref:MFS transporter n=1 Tax=Paractinoplanes maris TaxID=1734446 RepID=UPI0020202714|nr:MFS transporter [Actinoplanes maris]